MNASFWEGKRVLVTGHTGFKGSWLTVWLRKMGAEVIGYSLQPPTDPSMYVLARVAEGVVSIEGDVRDTRHLAGAVREHAPEIVFHMAAQALVKTAYADPERTFTTNVIGTLGVLEAVRSAPTVRVVVAITSDKCYENAEWVWAYRENDLLGGLDPYSSSKACAELLIAAYRNSYFPPDRIAQHGVRLASTRAGNVVGGGDWAENRLIPDIMKAIMSHKPVSIRQPAATRPWQFVLEPLRGYLDLAERLWEDGVAFTGAWNFGPDVDQIRPVQWLVEYLTDRWGGDATWDLDDSEHAHEAQLLMLDCTKAKNLLNWKPVLDLPTVLDWIVEWYKAYESGADVRVVTEGQIERYQSMVAG